jgi:FkbM family methyltransferase
VNPLRYNGRAFLAWHFRRFGALKTFAISRRLIGSVYSVEVNGVHLRPGTADTTVYDEIFVNGEYDIPFGSPKFIVDAGAHIGLASICFARRYPYSTIVALEPEDRNYALLVKNCAGLKNVYPIRAALWTHRTQLCIENPAADTWSYRMVESNGGIDAISMTDIMAMFGVDRVDVAKIDIEGSEREVMLRSGPWIDKVETIVIELHDRYRKGCADALEAAVRGRRFARSIAGEKLVLRLCH